jgi:hypothetical protein
MNDITTEADTGISVGKDESDTMIDMRNNISEVITDVLGGCSYNNDAAADAILEALPDMIAPLVWSERHHGFIFSGAYRIAIKGPLHSLCFSITSIGEVTDHDTLEQAQAAANTHHRDAIMAAFTGETTT